MDKHSDEWTMARAALGLIYRNKRLLESIGLEPSSPEAIEKTIKYFEKIRYESRYADRDRLVVLDLMINDWQVWEPADSPIEAIFHVELMAYLPAFETAYILESHDKVQDWNSIIGAFNGHYFDDFHNFHYTYEEWIGINCISNFLAFLLSEKIDCVYGSSRSKVLDL